MKALLALPSIALLLTAACADDQRAAETEISAVVQRFVLYYNSGHPDYLAALYVPDAHLMPANLRVIVGRPAIQTAFSQAMASKGHLKLLTEAVSASGDVAVERGTFEETYTLPGATTALTDRGKYLVHWQRIGGKWLIVDHIVNSDLPVAPAAAKP